jgi:murein DD-endopeptidase MepM/ murein hydrolase activator NlpD
MGVRKWVRKSLYRRSEFGFNTSGGVATLSLDQTTHRPNRTFFERIDDFAAPLRTSDFVPDLGSDIGSLRWWRGLVTCGLLCTTAILIAPPFAPLPGSAAPRAVGDAWEETRAQSIAPLAWGGDTGRRMAANDLVVPLGDTPERPSLTMTATLGQGDGFARVLERAGAGNGEAQNVAKIISSAVGLSDIKPGTVINLTLGRRTNRNSARPIDAVSFRARLDLALSLRRLDGRLFLSRTPIAVNHTPLRIQGVVGESLYRSARAAGVPAGAVEAYIKAIGSKLSFERDIDPSARFDIIVEQARAATGEIENGALLYAGMDRGGRKTQLQQWSIGGRTEWYEASGVGQKRAGMTSPIAGARISSGFGMRFHPILGYSRMHQGVDFAASYGTPVRAVTDGLVAFVGRHGGHGNHIRLNHSANLGTSYSHLSRYAVSPGERVTQGEIIGYVGSTGLSTGPHLHFEVYRGGAVVNPSSVSFASTSLLDGQALQNFRSRLAGLLATPIVGATR